MPEKQQVELYRKLSTYFLRDENGVWYLRVQPLVPGSFGSKRRPPEWLYYEVTDKQMTHFRRVNRPYSPRGKIYGPIVEEWRNTLSALEERRQKAKSENLVEV